MTANVTAFSAVIFTASHTPEIAGFPKIKVPVSIKVKLTDSVNVTMSLFLSKALKEEYHCHIESMTNLFADTDTDEITTEMVHYTLLGSIPCDANGNIIAVSFKTTRNSCVIIFGKTKKKLSELDGACHPKHFVEFIDFMECVHQIPLHIVSGRKSSIEMLDITLKTKLKRLKPGLGYEVTKRYAGSKGGVIKSVKSNALVGTIGVFDETRLENEVIAGFLQPISGDAFLIFFTEKILKEGDCEITLYKKALPPSLEERCILITTFDGYDTFSIFLPAEDGQVRSITMTI